MNEDVYAVFCQMCGIPDPKTFCPASEIPCQEFSDPERLCARPLVSVFMTTFNHARWIRQAIEGVLCQKTDFEYELVIGDDASTDGTFEICREYQRRYPDRVRVLWSPENQYATGGNERRIRHRCRGTYLASCEGDDYWTDPNKLQQQMDLIRRHGAVGCVAFNHWERPDGSKTLHGGKVVPFVDWRTLCRQYYHTSTFVYRRDLFGRYPEMRRWYDSSVLFVMAATGRVCLLPKSVSVYRMTGEGTWTGLSNCRQLLMNLGLYLDLYTHGPRNVPGLRRHFAYTALYRLVRLAKRGDAECEAFMARHRSEARAIYRQILREQPLLSRLLWHRLWFRSP